MARFLLTRVFLTYYYYNVEIYFQDTPSTTFLLASSSVVGVRLFLPLNPIILNIVETLFLKTHRL